jgi:hypothetical protein
MAIKIRTNTGGFQDFIDDGEVPPLEEKRKQAIRNGYKKHQEKIEQKEQSKKMDSIVRLALIILAILVILAIILLYFKFIHAPT